MTTLIRRHLSGTGAGTRSSSLDFGPGKYIFHSIVVDTGEDHPNRCLIALRIPKGGGKYTYHILKTGYVSQANVLAVDNVPLRVKFDVKFRIYSESWSLVAPGQHALNILFEKVS